MAHVLSVARDSDHRLSKTIHPRITLMAGQGVAADAHCGATVQHLSRIAKDPRQPNLRQVHLIHAELLDSLAADGFRVTPGVMGENITTRGIDLLGLPTGARLHIGAEAVIEITGLRNPCAQLDGIYPGLMAAVLGRDAHGAVIRLAGVMAIVIRGGDVAAGDSITVAVPPPPHRTLVPV